MAKTWKIIYSKTSRQDLLKISDYIMYTLQSQQGADNTTNKIQQAIESLNFMPLKFPLYPKEPWHSLGLHFVPVGHYTVFYHPVEEKSEVQIIRIMYSGRNVSKHLPSSLKIN